MKKIILFTTTYLLISQTHAMTSISCAQSAPHANDSLQIKIDDEVPANILFKYSTDTTFSKLEIPNGYCRFLTSETLFAKDILVCVRMYGPDGGTAYKLVRSKLSGKYKVQATPYGPTGNGKPDHHRCEVAEQQRIPNPSGFSIGS